MITKKEFERRNYRRQNPSKIPVRCVETSQYYESIAEAARQTGICETSIRDCIHYQQRTAGGYHWITNKKYCRIFECKVNYWIENSYLDKENQDRTKLLYKAYLYGIELNPYFKIIINMIKNDIVNPQKEAFIQDLIDRIDRYNDMRVNGAEF